MRTIFLLASAASLVLGAPALAQGNGNGGGNGGGGNVGGGNGGGGNGNAKQQGPGREAKAGPARGGGDDRGKGQKRAEAPRDERGRGNDKAAVKFKETGKGDDRGPTRSMAGSMAGDRDYRRDDSPQSDSSKFKVKDANGAKRAGRDGWRDTNRLFVDRTWDGNRYRYDDRAYVVPTTSWCPPGLAKKNNGCLPPGQARKLDQYDGWSNWYPVRYRDDGYDWRYNDGYMYRSGSDGLVSALIPLIGGALFGGQVWPEQYTGYEAPAYYDSYYGNGGYGDGYDYRVAQNAIFAVDPDSGQIDGIAGLLTGDRWSVGQQMPAGYDVYNVPPSYRDRYSDRDDAMYRYSDGYVYEVDPTTQLVRAVMELLV